MAPAGLTARFEAFVQSHHQQAVRIAWRLTGADLATAEEIAHDAFVRAHQRLHTLDDPEALRAWFYRILVRRAANHRRWRAVRARAVSFLGGKGESVPGGSSDPALRARIAQAMERLSDGQRTVFTLVYLEGFTLDESALLLGKAPGTVRSHLHRALKTLRAELEEAMEDHR